MNTTRAWSVFFLISSGLATGSAVAQSQQPNVFADVVDRASFEETRQKMSAAKDGVIAAHRKLLEERYDLSNKPSSTVKMSRGKPVQTGVRVKLKQGVTWESLASMTPDQIKQRDVYPGGFLPLPHPNHPEGGMLFPKSHIDLVNAQESRDLTRFDLDFVTPEHLLAETPSAIFLTTRPDLGDVSKGKLVTLSNYYELFSGILNPKQLEGLRLLVTPFPQQQFNATIDRRSLKPSQGVACFDCHANGNTNGATHLVGDIRPQEFRHRIETPTLRGVNVQRLFGSQRALKSVEDFTEFEQRAAYFDGDPVIATKKGVNILERGSQVHFMSEFQDILDFPPAPALDVFGRLDPAKATPAQLRGEKVFHGKGKCGTCHVPPYYTDNEMHDLQTGRFFTPREIEKHMAVTDGKIKTFPLRGIKDSPPYLHDGRLLTLEDTVEFFNVVLQTRLTNGEKQDLVAFLQAL
jgi:cytochrome c peroxidase